MKRKQQQDRNKDATFSDIDKDKKRGGMNRDEANEKNLSLQHMLSYDSSTLGPRLDSLMNFENFEDFSLFKNATETLTISLAQSKSFTNIIATGSLFYEILDEFFVNDVAIKAFTFLEKQIERIQSSRFSWNYAFSSIKIVLQIFEFFDCFEDELHFIYINLDPIRDLLPLTYFIKFFSQPFKPNEGEIELFGDVMTFQSTLFNVFIKIYFKSFFATRSKIIASKIYVVDPLMRNKIRRANQQYFIDHFWTGDDFELYKFLKNLFDRYILAGLPHWVTPSL